MMNNLVYSHMLDQNCQWKWMWPSATLEPIPKIKVTANSALQIHLVTTLQTDLQIADQTLTPNSTASPAPPEPQPLSTSTSRIAWFSQWPITSKHYIKWWKRTSIHTSNITMLKWLFLTLFRILCISVRVFWWTSWNIIKLIEAKRLKIMHKLIRGLREFIQWITTRSFMKAKVEKLILIQWILEKEWPAWSEVWLQLKRQPKNTYLKKRPQLKTRKKDL